MISLADISDAPVGEFRPIKVEFICDCDRCRGDLFGPKRLTMETSASRGYIEVAGDATAQGWLRTANLDISPFCLP